MTIHRNAFFPPGAMLIALGLLISAGLGQGQTMSFLRSSQLGGSTAPLRLRRMCPEFT